MKSLESITVGVLVVMLITAVVFYALQQQQYKYVSSYSDENYAYTCAKPLKAKFQNVYFEGGPSKVYVPINKGEASQYCKITAAY